MRSLVWTLGGALVASSAVGAQCTIDTLADAVTGQIRVMRPVCSEDNLYYHHDGTFENGVAWDYGGVREPYDGAFGEAYDLGPGAVECVSLWLTQTGNYLNQPTDVYVWEGGVAGTPGTVLALVGGVVFEDIPFFPEGGRYDVEIAVSASGEMTVGSWGDWPWQAPNGYYWLVDQNGPVGRPWTHVAEDLGFPPGWQDPGPLWGFPIHSIGIGVHFAGGGSPADPTTWGSVKRLFASAR